MKLTKATQAILSVDGTRVCNSGSRDRLVVTAVACRLSRHTPRSSLPASGYSVR
jgi:hypothetical protein